ncbi:hypothetical protein LXL04_031926 [Taraxacum kok-saghyz]
MSVPRRQRTDIRTGIEPNSASRTSSFSISRSPSSAAALTRRFRPLNSPISTGSPLLNLPAQQGLLLADFASVQHLQAPILPLFSTSKSPPVGNRLLQLSSFSYVLYSFHHAFFLFEAIDNNRSFHLSRTSTIQVNKFIEHQQENHFAYFYVKKQTVFFMQTADVWSTSSAAEGCRCGPQTADVLASKKQTVPKCFAIG